jgi:hypothetical protein
MVWPFKEGELSFAEDVLSPASELIVEYTGKEPFWVMNAAGRLMRDVMKITTVQLREDEVRWDTTGDTKDFYGIFRAYRTEDAWSKTLVRIIVQGDIGKDRTGYVKIKIKGILNTKFEYPTPIHKWLWEIWNYTFYYKQRRAYIDFAKDDIMTIREKILEAYGIARGP